MAIRKILKYGDETLRGKSKEVIKISKKIQVLIDDMLDTMYVNNGVGLAAPQVGELLRVFVVDVDIESKRYNPIVFINPKIIKKSGAMSCSEGCLSFPEVYTEVRRYQNVTVKALDRHGKPFILEGKDGSLLARAIQHEFDHLNGVLFVDHVRNRFESDEILKKFGLPTINPEYLIDESELEEEISKAPVNDENEQQEEK